MVMTTGDDGIPPHRVLEEGRCVPCWPVNEAKEVRSGMKMPERTTAVITGGALLAAVCPVAPARIN